MGKTYKDKANYFRFKDKHDEADARSIELIDVMDAHEGAGLRHGNNRKAESEAKTRQRRAERRRNKRDWSNDG